VRPIGRGLIAMDGSAPSTGPCDRRKPVLSLILCSRNDAYMGNSRWRLETALNYVGERVHALGREEDVEVLVTDWGSHVPLREVVALEPAAARIVSFLTVPPAVAHDLQKDSPFPEVLALNAAARRAHGDYIGRIDQDTLVGERFLNLFFELIERKRTLGAQGATPETAMFFANRRSIPYRFAAASPSLRCVTRFVRVFGQRLAVWRANPIAGDVFWTSYVGIWLAHRNLWHECGGYDERMIYYNWMETEMICRLARKHTMVNLGELTCDDFYHLEHYHPTTKPLGRRRPMKNAEVKLTAPHEVLHPNSAAWGLLEHPLTRQPSASAPMAGRPAVRNQPFRETVAFIAAMGLLAGGMVSDRAVVLLTVQYRIARRRMQVVLRELRSQPITDWANAAWRLWNMRSAARRR